MALAVTVPDQIEMIVGEKLNTEVDLANVITPGDVTSGLVVTITNLTNNELVPSAIVGSPTLVSNIVHLTLTATSLRRQTKYLVRFSFTATGGGYAKNVSAQLTINVIY